MAPPGAPLRPTDLNVVTGGPPGRLEPLSAIAHWPGAVSLSWSPLRPHDWLDLLDAIEGLQARPLRAKASSRTAAVAIEGAGKCHLNARVMPHLGVSLLQLHGLGQTVVAVARCTLADPPKAVRLIAV